MRILIIMAFCSVLLTACSTSPRDAELRSPPLNLDTVMTQAEMNTKLHQLSIKLDESMNQIDMNISQGEITNLWRRRLDEMILEIHYLYSDDQRFLHAFDTAQKKWEDYCDAMMEARFPGEDKQMEYGSIYPFAFSAQLAGLLKIRIAEMSPWTEGTEEGDVTSGSVAIKEHLDELRRSRKKDQPDANPRAQAEK